MRFIMATKPPINSIAFSGVSLCGAALQQEDAFFVDPQSASLLLMDGAGASLASTQALIKETVASFAQALRKRQGLSVWLEGWNEAVFHSLQAKRLEDRSTLSILAGRLRSHGVWEFVVLGRLALYQVGPSDAYPLVFNSASFPLESLGTRSKCNPFLGSYTCAPGEWLLAGSGDFAAPAFVSRLPSLRDYLLLQDCKAPAFRDSAKLYTENEMLSPGQNSSLLWVGARPLSTN
jgi:hypothetical protein